MTLLSFSLPPVSLSSLTEASSVVSYPQHLLRRLSSLARINSNDTLSTASLAAALFLTLVAVIVTMSWRDPFAFWRRNPSYNAQPGSSPPHVRDSDFSYLTGDDVGDETHHHSSHHTQQQPQYIERRPRANNGSGGDAPDILLLKHRGVTYPLHFPAYAIDDGVLTVGDIRRRAAEKTAATDLQRIKILYKGKLLRDDGRACKDEGLKQQSEIMCIVSDVRPGESTSDLSDDDGDDKSSEAGGVSSSNNGQQQRPSKNKRKNDKKKDKKKKKRDEAAAADLSSADGGGLAPPPVTHHHHHQRPTSPSGRSTTSSAAPPSPSPSLQNIRTGNAQVDALLHYLRGELAPMCESYIAQPPADQKARDYEHKRLSETILAQVILKADGIDSEDARMARRALIKEAQSWLNRIDEVDRDV
ncbi:uncharacterized protein TRUGW13939_03787 [Talaromyces rugulosus]|uniref:BAG domain-containing protein n=1 Tax=Talaromyces rugulosus TaxID=121627 RepID=A0A7H8QT38_TALRU|nr:uncharacterized protein TRUGW13939_03787 [Talaromyces rugulosus]QKX56681.1 hypothetical protein TRUGW13939_03787 [Talaromyces rugulosus]